MRELPFGARISDSFLGFLKRATAKAKREMPEVLPCLCAEEERHCHYQTLGRREPQPNPIDLEEGPEMVPVNRLAPSPDPPAILIKERVWVLYFDKRRHPPEATFDIDGLELHISKQAQAELRGATLNAVDDKIVTSYDPA